MAQRIIYSTVDFPNDTLFAPGGPEALFRDTVNDFMTDVGYRGINIAEAETPVGATGELRDSINFQRTGFLAGTLRWDSPHSKPADVGSAPHYAPIQRLSLWTAVKWGSYEAGADLQDLIAQQGTQGNGFSKRTALRLRERIKQLWPGAITRYVRRLIS